MSSKIIQPDFFIHHEVERIVHEKAEAEKKEIEFQSEVKNCIRGLFARDSKKTKELDDLKIIIFNLYQDVKRLKDCANA